MRYAFHWRFVFWNSIHQEVASDSFCFLLYSSWLLVFILYVFNLFFLSLELLPERRLMLRFSRSLILHYLEDIKTQHLFIHYLFILLALRLCWNSIMQGSILQGFICKNIWFSFHFLSKIQYFLGILQHLLNQGPTFGFHHQSSF